MIEVIRLFLAVLFPSWRFFAEVGARAEVEVAPDGRWMPALERPNAMGAGEALLRLCWNPARNEALFLVSLAERALTEPGGPGRRLLEARLIRLHGQTPYRIWLDTGADRDIAFEGVAREL